MKIRIRQVEHGATLKDMNMPQGTRVIMIKREEDYIVPTGKLTLKEGDKMVILVSEEDKEETEGLYNQCIRSEFNFVQRLMINFQT